MPPRLVVFFLLLIVLFLIIRENMITRPDRLYQTTSGHVEMCLSCHKSEKLDPAHDARTLGCSPCHLGDTMAIDKEKAHKGIVKNPGDLRVVEKTCGIEGCHAPDIKKIKNSLMATNRGILSTLLYYWGEAENQNGNFSVEELLVSGRTSLALDYFRKLCATCHLWKPKGDLPGFFGTKGGGCTACHSLMPPGYEPPANDTGKKIHPLISKKIPVENCVRCHNRSGRIGISYTGVYESENYGTPYKNGQMSKLTLPGNRYYLELPPDIHYKQGMGCIDCHTRDEVMGDGTGYAHYEEQLEIKCESCHPASPIQAAKIGLTRKNNKMTNIEKDENSFVLVNRLNGKKQPLKPARPGICNFSGHKRLTCESCHSAWVPQCYGCHVKRDMRETHLDKLSMKETAGWWQEGRSYLRYEEPMLAVWGNEIVVVTPGCQDIVTLVDEEGRADRRFNRLTMAAINPHTTQAKGRACPECHINSKTLGLGQGTVSYENSKWLFTPASQGVTTEIGPTPPLDAFGSIDGHALQHGSRPDLRPFNREELGRILRVGLCLECHKEYNDPAYKNYGPETRCRKGIRDKKMSP